MEGPLALRMQRAAAARAGAIGREILTLPQMASRLAGGFLRAAGPEHLYPPIRAALAQGGFAELEAVRDLPGTPRAVARSLHAVWRADLALAERSEVSPRLADLHLIERRVRDALPVGVLLPAALREAAMARLRHAPALLGSVTLQGLLDVDPVWRPLVAALARAIDVAWRAPTESDRSWFPGRIVRPAPAAGCPVEAEACADPRAEAVEAMRWARALLTRGIAASDIAITAAVPASWDDHLLVLSREAGLPMHFSHGIPALSTHEGQACAALADSLVQGLSQQRIRRLVRRLPSSSFRSRFPEGWWAALPAEAGLFTVDHWKQVLAKPEASAAGAPLLELVELVARGTEAAEDAGRLLLTGQSRLLWDEALRVAPAAAIHISLGELRLPDALDPANSIAWCPAAHLAASPRAHVRILGLTSGGWPRTEREDPMLPDHVLPRRTLESVSITERDRQMYDVIRMAADGLILSRGRRSASGTVQSPSALWPSFGEMRLARTRIPVHAFSEADRLLARPREAATSPLVAASRQCWRDWQLPALTAHDCATGAHSEAAVGRALARPQSASSIRRLLRDPAGFVWREALHWRAPALEQQPLVLPRKAFGELVHELIRRAIEALEAEPGVGVANETEIGDTINAAIEAVDRSWPLERAVPPPLLWQHTLQEAARHALRAFRVDDTILSDTRSWTELPFGEAEAVRTGLPWDAVRPIAIPGTEMRMRGRIDRVDLRPDGSAVRITDYKSGRAPEDAAEIVLAGGAELQRVLYAMAARQLLPEVRTIVARLAYLAGESGPMRLQGETLDEAMADAAEFIGIAARIVRGGAAPPGPDALDPFYEMRLALPADREAYLRRKEEARDAALGELVPLWRRQ
ncbi:MAG: PD-(D/E)XK nuclease family protein [Hyphomonadaceae bacterium]|nr:PD-(D/E)XK nuclease family protein [Hyphomonadaceae bacterium]